ncbi:S1 family peptidase [Pelagibius marinus]|uniref:S1 family peptidase n=1 Tax=Pelagibius marinus TaxID=2762760 RepID=UPI001872DFB8|nr:serine protease [Pelagibius marinus]
MQSATVPKFGIAAAILLALFAARPAGGQNGHVIVHCLDEVLGIVQDTLADDCKGRVATEEEAVTARNQRRDYIQKVLANPGNSKLKGKRLASSGSGFFVDDDGGVLTSRHLVEDCIEVTVAPSFGAKALVTSMVSDDRADLALLHTGAAPTGIAVLAQDGGPAVVGPAFIAGYPEQGMVSLIPVLTAVEVLRRESHTPRGPAMIVRGDVRRGGSGGPLLDTGGNVIGVVVAKVDTVATYNATGKVVRDIGFVLPIDRVRRFLDAQDVRYHSGQRRPLQPEERLRQDTRPFMVQVGCWK